MPDNYGPKNEIMNKAFETAGSSNFMISILTLVFGYVGYQSGVDINALDTASTVWDNITSGNWFALIGIASVNLVQPIRKMIASGNFNPIKAFKLSGNFRTQLAAVLASGVGLIGWNLDPEAVVSFFNTIPGGELMPIIVAGITHILNSLLHFIKENKGKVKPA